MWYFEDKQFTEEDIPEGIQGFVYEITNLDTGRKYLGKKNFWRKLKRPPLKGKSRRRISTIKTDWETYYGSSPSLLKDIELMGVDKFDRKILRLCRNKTEMSYYEAKYQFDNDVLLSEDYYNDWIAVKVTKVGL